MTISNTTCSVIHIGNGVATQFPFTFPVYRDDDFNVRLYTIADGTFVTLTEVNYTVTGIGPGSTGGMLTYNPPGGPITNSKALVIFRNVAYTQDLLIPNQSAFYPRAVEQQLDLIVMQIQQLAAIFGFSDGYVINVGGRRIVNLGDPIQDQDAATKNWTEAELQKLYELLLPDFPGVPAVVDGGYYDGSGSQLTRIRWKRSLTPGDIPALAELVEGEVAINLVDGKIYYRDHLNNVKEFTSPTRIASYANHADLKAADTTAFKTAVTQNDSRLYTFTPGDFSAGVAADPNEGSYLKANAIAATSGAWLSFHLVNGDIFDFFREFNLAPAASVGAAVDMTTAWDRMVIECSARKKKLLLRGNFDGSIGYIKLQPGRYLPSHVFVDGQVQIVSTAQTGLLFRQTGWMRGEGRLIIDGGRDSDNHLNGYMSGHKGLYIGVEAEGAGGTPTAIDRVMIEGWTFLNFGEYGMVTQYLNGAVFRDVNAKRIGVAGTIHWSPVDMLQEGGRIETIFPGLPNGLAWQNSKSYLVPGPGVSANDCFAIDVTNGKNYIVKVAHTSPASGTFAAARAANPTYWGIYTERNAYCFSASMYGEHRQAQNVTFKDITGHDVVSWTIGDTHSSLDVRFINIRGTRFSQGIGCENHLSGVRMSGMQVIGCNLRGFNGGSFVKDTETFYSVLGIAFNSSGSGVFQSENGRIANNTLYECGEQRPGVSGGGAAVGVRFGRVMQIEGNQAYASKQVAYQVIGTASGTDDCLSVQLNGNTSDSVSVHTGVSKGFYIGSWVDGAGKGNFSRGLSLANAYVKDAPGHSFTWGTNTQVSAGLTSQGDNNYVV